MRSTIFTTTALALIGSVLAVPTSIEPLNKRDLGDDDAICMWKSASSLLVQWAVQIPAIDDRAPEQMKDAFLGSIGDSSACRGPSKFAPGMKYLHPVGAEGKTALITLATSDFCTAYQMTKVIKDTTGGKQATPCAKYEGPEEMGALLPPIIKREAEPAPLAQSQDSSDEEKMKDAEMAKRIGLPEDATHEEIIQKLSGPSSVDNERDG